MAVPLLSQGRNNAEYSNLCGKVSYCALDYLLHLGKLKAIPRVPDPRCADPHLTMCASEYDHWDPILGTIPAVNLVEGGRLHVCGVVVPRLRSKLTDFPGTSAISAMTMTSSAEIRVYRHPSTADQWRAHHSTSARSSVRGVAAPTVRVISDSRRLQIFVGVCNP